MRFLPALLLIAAPLLAQESDADRQRAETERAAEEAARAAKEGDLAAKEARQKQYIEAAELLRRAAEQRSKWGMTEQELRRLLEELRSKSEAKREEAMAAIKRANASIDDLLPLIAQVLENAERARAALGTFQIGGGPLGTRALLLDTNSGSAEVISGSADGTDYTLKSLGAGKYELAATKRAEDDKVMEETKDQGTIKELQEKYAFLRSGLGLAIQMSAQPLVVAGHGGRLFTATVQGGATAAVTWGGGGKVGVLVMPPTEDLRFHLEIPEGAGFIVQDVVAGSRAEQIGIRRMDVLLRLDGELIDSPIQLKKLHEKTGVLEIIRRSETKKIDLATIVVDEKPAQIVVEPAPAESAPAGAR